MQPSNTQEQITVATLQYRLSRAQGTPPLAATNHQEGEPGHETTTRQI